MAAIKTFLNVLVICFAFAAPLSSACAEGPLDGTYYWETGVDEEPTKYVDVVVRTVGDEVSVLLEVVWNPGAHVEARATAAAVDITSAAKEGGNIVHTLPFVFRDAFNNKGEGVLSVSGNQCQVTINVTELVDARAARQYEDWTLTRRASDTP